MLGAPPCPNVRDLGIKISVAKNLEWGASGKLELKEGTTKVWIDPEAAAGRLPASGTSNGSCRLNGMPSASSTASSTAS